MTLLNTWAENSLDCIKKSRSWFLKAPKSLRVSNNPFTNVVTWNTLEHMKWKLTTICTKLAIQMTLQANAKEKARTIVTLSATSTHGHRTHSWNLCSNLQRHTHSTSQKRCIESWILVNVLHSAHLGYQPTGSEKSRSSPSTEKPSN